jgi:hypothetical protein
MLLGMEGFEAIGNGAAMRITVMRDGGCGRLLVEIAHEVDGEPCLMSAEGCPPECPLAGLGCGDRATWMASGDPAAGTLSLAPGLHCAAHGFAGYVRDGRWEPA